MTRLGYEDVTKRYGDVLALDDVSLAVEPSGFHCLLGPNGSGKTTLLRLLLGLERPTSGTVHRDGVTFGGGFQRPSFYPSLSVRENLAVFETLLAGTDADWRDHLVSELGLSDVLGRQAGDLSGGFARKLDLALAMLKRPDVVVLDEPLGALDDVSVARLLAFLADYAGDGNTVLVSTHQVTSFEPYLDRVTVVHDGTVVADRERETLDVGDPEALQSWYVDMVLAREDVGTDGAAADDGV